MRSFVFVSGKLCAWAYAYTSIACDEGTLGWHDWTMDAIGGRPYAD
ncbi:hypothetical protein [Mesorhizobium sp.]|nr:hypothetical protein [Mesorhizobium sp.]